MSIDLPADASLCMFLPSPEATSWLGEWLSTALRPGDVVLLHGQIGAGKSHLARALIRARLGRMEDVPSPTFTLVQTYATDEAEIWHADLYRLTQLDEITELGLEAAFETAICLIEWPERLGDLAPKNIDAKRRRAGRGAALDRAHDPSGKSIPGLGRTCLIARCCRRIF